MKNINHRNIQLIPENLQVCNAVIQCELPMPKFILDSCSGKLFQKNKTIFEPGQQSRVAYSEVPVVALSSVELVAEAVVDV